MIRTLRKPLLKEWTTAQTLKPNAYSTRSFSRCNRGIIYITSPPLSRNSLFTSLSVAQLAHPRYSTVPSHADVKRRVDIPPPTASAPSRKPKVELRPAPKVLNKESRNVPGQPRSHNPAAHATNSGSSTTHTSTSTPNASSTTKGPIKALEQDIAQATKHGVLSPPPEGASLLGRYWHKFKQLFWFYWAGMKMIFVTHRKQASAIQQRVQEAKARGEQGVMTRWETRFLRTYKSDIVKLFPFILTIIILEEVLPLIILYLPGLLPTTCLLESQRERIETKRRTKQLAYTAMAKEQLQLLTSQRQYDASLVQENGLNALTAEVTCSVAGILARPTWGPHFLQRQRIARHLAYLSADDALLVKEEMGSRLREAELVEALEERGIILESPTPQRMLEKLQWWLKGASDDNARLGLVLRTASCSGTETK